MTGNTYKQIPTTAEDTQNQEALFLTATFYPSDTNGFIDMRKNDLKDLGTYVFALPLLAIMNMTVGLGFLSIFSKTLRGKVVGMFKDVITAKNTNFYNKAPDSKNRIGQALNLWNELASFAGALIGIAVRNILLYIPSKLISPYYRIKHAIMNANERRRRNNRLKSFAKQNGKDALVKAYLRLQPRVQHPHSMNAKHALFKNVGIDGATFIKAGKDYFKAEKNPSQAVVDAFYQDQPILTSKPEDTTPLLMEYLVALADDVENQEATINQLFEDFKPCVIEYECTKKNFDKMILRFNALAEKHLPAAKVFVEAAKAKAAACALGHHDDNTTTARPAVAPVADPAVAAAQSAQHGDVLAPADGRRTPPPVITVPVQSRTPTP